MNIFIAYNTNSITQCIKTRYYNTFQISDKMSSFEIFECLNNYYNMFGEHKLYFDIIQPQICNEQLSFINRNRYIIKNSKLMIFVIDTKEISFWQLQEAYFASYYNKPMIYLTSKRFIKLIINKRLDHYIRRFVSYT